MEQMEYAPSGLDRHKAEQIRTTLESRHGWPPPLVTALILHPEQADGLVFDIGLIDGKVFRATRIHGQTECPEWVDIGQQSDGGNISLRVSQIAWVKYMEEYESDEEKGRDGT